MWLGEEKKKKSTSPPHPQIVGNHSFSKTSFSPPPRCKARHKRVQSYILVTIYTGSASSHANNHKANLHDAVDCHFQDIFSEIIPHSGNLLLIIEEILIIVVWSDYIIGKHRSYFPCRVVHTCILVRTVIFHFWKSVNNGPVALKNSQKYINTSKLNMSKWP